MHLKVHKGYLGTRGAYMHYLVVVFNHIYIFQMNVKAFIFV